MQFHDTDLYYSDKKFSFRVLRADSVITYSERLHCLVFNCIRFYVREGWSSEYRYPDIDDSQIQALRVLEQSLDDESSLEDIDSAFHKVCLALLAHEKDDFDTSRLLDSNFFSPVICFLVVHCITETGGTPNSSGISNVVAPIMYAIRTAIFKVILERKKKEKISPHRSVLIAFFY